MDGSETGYPKPALMTLYRAAQEGLTNIHKHAQASHVWIKVCLGDQSASLHIRDNGKGFTEYVENLPNRQGQYGLQGIRERLELVGGDMSLESDTINGTTLTVTIPKQRLTEPIYPGSQDE